MTGKLDPSLSARPWLLAGLGLVSLGMAAINLLPHQSGLGAVFVAKLAPLVLGLACLGVALVKLWGVRKDAA